MRCDQYIGLNEWAKKNVYEKAEEEVILITVHPRDGVVKHHKTTQITAETIGKIEGAWEDVVSNLYKYEVDGKIYREFIQAKPWSSGPMYFIALKDENGKPVPESLWDESEFSQY